MRRISVFVASIAISFVMALSGLAFSPAHASALADGNYLCSTGVITTTMGPTYTITDDVVSAGSLCGGDIVISAGVRSIEHHAFTGAGSITSVTFADDGMLTDIGVYAFEWVAGLTSIAIPASVTTIGAGAFFADSALASIFFLGNDPAIDGDIFLASQYTQFVSVSPTKAYFRTGATGFASDIDGKWNGVPISPFYKLTFDGTDSESGSAPRQIFSGAGENVTSPDNTGGLTKAGYDFAGWTDGLGHLYPAGSVGTMPAIDGTLYVTWAPNLVDGSYLCSTGKPTSETTDIYTITTSGSDVTVSDGSTCTGALVIPEGVTAIGGYAFGGATGLTSISLPETLNAVGDSPFYQTRNLTQINVAPNNPDFASVDGVLFGRNGISAALIAYPANRNDSTYTTPRTVSFTGGIAAEVTTIRSYAFQRAQKLATLTVSEDVTTLGGGFDASLLSVINLPETLNQVGSYPFYGTSNLTQINVAPNNPDFASVDGVLFGRNGISATLIAYPANKASSMYTTPLTVSFTDRPNAAVTSIDTYAFQNAQKLETLNISEGVTTLGGGIAESTRLLSVINLPATYTAMTGQPFGDAYGLTSITIQASVVSIASRTFINARSLSNIYFLGNEPRLGDEPGVHDDAFSGIASGAKAYVKSDADGFDLDVITGKWKGLTVVDLAPDGDYVCSTGSKTTADTLPLTPRYKITNGVVSDGSSCAGTVLIPDGIKAIGNSGFEGATTLTSITIPAGVISIGDNAFLNTTNLASFTVEADNPNYSVNDGVLLNKTGTTLLHYPVGKTATSYSIPSDVTSIGSYAFYGENSLTSITIPTGLTSIGNSSFRNTAGLTSINLPASLNSIGDDAFSFATALTSITIPANVANIGSNAFDYAVVLSSVYFLGDAPIVGTDAFANIATSSNAYIKTGNTTFSPVVNGKWNNLTVAFFNVVTYEANGGSPVSAVGFTTGGTLSAPNAPTRDGYGFAGWSRSDGGAAVVFPYSPGGTSDVTLFAKWLVDGSYECTTGLGTTPQLPPPSAINTYPITNGVVVTNHSANGSNNCAGAVVISEGVTSIGDDAFAAASFMTDITISASVTTIGNYAFYGTTSLEDVTFAADSRLIAINNFAFQYATSLTSITIPGSVTSIGGSAFGNASKLSNIYFLGNAPTVGESAFTDIGEAPKAYVKNANVSSFTPLVDGKWNGLTVVIVDPPVVDPPVVDPPVVDPPVVPPSGITSDTAADLAAAKLAAGKLAAADLAARTVSKKKTFVAKTLAKRVGIKTVSSKATVTMSVSKSSKKICVVSKSKLMTLKGGKCIVTFTVQEPKPKKGKLPKATKTTKTLVVN